MSDQESTPLSPAPEEFTAPAAPPSVATPPEGGVPPETVGTPPPQGGGAASPFSPVAPPAGAAPGQPAPSRASGRSSRAWIPWVAGGTIGCLPWIILFFILVGRMAGGSMRSPLPNGDKIGLVYLDGPITGGRGSASFLGVSGGSDAIARQLESARRDPSIKAVLLRINSPGGSSAASQELYEEVMKLRRAHKPVIASLGDVAASGGYYVASAANKIMANGSTLTGSIGVIMEMQNLQGLYRKIGVNINTVKSGKFKDIGSSNRPMTAEERRMLQNMINDVYEQFVRDVSAGRKQLSVAQLRGIADGRVFTGRQALKLKLIDALGNFQDAVALAGREAGIRGRPTVVEIGKRGLLDILGNTDSAYDGRLRLPASSAEQERLVSALRRLMQEQALPR